MSAIKFNSDLQHFYQCLECSTKGDLATITDIEDYPIDISGGFGVFESDGKNYHLVADLSDYDLVWETSENKLVFSNDHTTYRTYFIYDNDKNYITSEVTTAETRSGKALLVDEGIGREHKEYEHIELFDEDGFYLYKVKDGKKMPTTAEDKEEWLKQFEYNVYYNFNENNFVESYEVNQEEPKENQVFVRTEFSKEGTPSIDDKLFDEDGFYVYKVVEGEVVNTTTEDKEAWEEEKKAKELKEAKEKKITEFSDACAQAIIDGVDVNGSHYSYNYSDQNNISNSMNLAIQTGLAIPYHADNENCRLFTRDELIEIYITEELNVTGQVTYNNQMKQYIETLETVEEVEAIHYGTSLTGEYLETYNEMLAQAEEVIRHITEENAAAGSTQS